jgi:Asp-tRNA(Asn)/Glu-tRNA(Gln) amidotransferase A subunit family amidase
MALSDELAYLSASELALRIRRRDLSPVEVVDAFITRIEARNPSINALSISASRMPVSARRRPNRR